MAKRHSVSRQKVCGILLESATEDERVRYCIAGIGISANLKESDFPEESRGVATSIRMAGGATVNRTGLIQSIMAEMEVLYELYNEQGFVPIASLGSIIRHGGQGSSRRRPVTVLAGLPQDSTETARRWFAIMMTS